MKKILLGIIALSIGSAGFSQEMPEKYQYKKGKLLGVHFTLHDFETAADLKDRGLSSVLNEKQWYKTSRMSPGIAVSYTQGLTDNIDFMARLGGAFLAYPLPNKPAPVNDKLLLESDANINLKLLSDHYWVSPYLSAGVGASMWNGYFGAYIPTGLGLQVNILDATYIFLQAQYRIPVASNTTASHLFYGFGIAGNIGKKKAPVVLAPPPPPPPADTDKDGIIDSLDACPTVPGLAQFKGCPDTDKDGIEDSQDKCPTVAGLAKYQGCPIPDTDNDGINDEEDSCATVAGLAKYHGCPIPDTDNDGVNDEEDKCPTIPGVAENNGCPLIKFNASNVQFATGTATLTKGAKTELNKVVPIMNTQYPDIKVTIEGHTDNTGKAETNQKLSESRAAAVKKYLVSKGISADRLTTVGYGAEQPIEDNKTAAGKAKNRRVAFKLSQ
jgi:OmpA-OmpF porin, OOP family